MAEYNDYFDNVPEEEDETQQERQPQPEPETPEQIEAREIAEQTIGRRGMGKMRRTLFTILAIVAVGIAAWIYVIFWVPYVKLAQQRGVVASVEMKGTIFDTYEGQMITDDRFADTIHVYKRDFLFSVENDSIARGLMQLQATGKRVTLTYKKYRGALPWRGSQRIIVTGYEVK